jgi:Ca2+-binding RTX toxin-like protein
VRARLVVALLAVLGALVFVPASAFAGFARMEGSTMVYTDNSGDASNAVVEIVGGRVQLTDSQASGMGAELPCEADGQEVDCPLSLVALVSASLGDADDRITVASPVLVSIGGGGGGDTMTGGPLGDQLRGGDGADRLLGSGGDDTIIGDNPATESQVAGGADIVDGGVGNDNLNGGVAPDQVAGGAGNDNVSGGDGNDLLTGGDGNDVMEATQGDRAGDDSLDGGTGDDTMHGGTGPNGRDTFIGGVGRDGALFAERSNPVVVTLDGQPNDGEPNEGDNVRADVEDVTGGTGGDTIVGSGVANTLSGGPGNDDVAGGAGDDRLVAGQGDDTLRGEAAANGRDTLVGGLGRDLAAYGARARNLSLTLDGQANDGESGERDNIGADIEDAAGGAGGDRIRGNPGANFLAGGSGSDDLGGGPGNDSLAGGDGNDDAAGGLGDDALDGGPGENYLDGSTGADSFAAGNAGDVFRSRDGVADSLSCAGNDFVVADRADTTAGCVRVDLDVAHRPVLAVSAVVRPTDGSVEMSPVGIARLVPLKDTINLPMGSNLDSRDAKVKVTSSGGSGAARQAQVVRSASAQFSEGLFQIRQVQARRARTDLIMRGGDFGACGGSASALRAVAAQRRSKRTVRRLFGNGRGRFRTRGRYSAATVRGTNWAVRDRCDGTLTSVRRGRVAVFDFGRRKTIFVRTGRSYLARASRAALRRGR